jgi:hypothetical protein
VRLLAVEEVILVGRLLRSATVGVAQKTGSHIAVTTSHEIEPGKLDDERLVERGLKFPLEVM